MSIGRLSSALHGASNESTMALANFNLDFSMMKFEAPKEFSGLGLALSRKRKADAEDGNLHRTARRLGAIFEGVIPDTPALFKAYGDRVSEIASSPQVKRSSDGPGFFASAVGVDSASIWAAATSGSGAIAMHLLACMLSRVYTGPKAVSMWSELVAERRRQIIEGEGESLNNLRAITASMLDITRADLSHWDVSARSWLQTADSAQLLQHKQLMLMWNNSEFPVTQETDFYQSLIAALNLALKTTNNLLLGIPQQSRDGAILLGMSAWHLYPDMIVLGYGGGVSVTQKDSLFAPTAVLTVGLKGGESYDDHWSLSLSHIQPSADTVHASESASMQNLRLTFNQFQFIIMGCVFGDWRVVPGWEEFDCTLENGIDWLQKIVRCFTKDNPSSADIYFGHQRTALPRWLQYLHDAGQSFVKCDEGIEKGMMRRLFGLGTRRHSFWLSGSNPSPLFGLSLRSVIEPLLHKSALEGNVIAGHGATNSQDFLTMDETDRLLMDEVDVKKVVAYLWNLESQATMPENTLQNLQAFAAAARLYDTIPGATISSLILAKPFASYHWCMELQKHSTLQNRGDYSELSLSRTQALSCVSLFDSACDINPTLLENVFAISSGDSIYIAEELLLDPSCIPSTPIRRLTGNIGRAGVSLLISPLEPKVRGPDIERWHTINHDAFDGMAQDCFSETSLHMSLTGYTIPVPIEGSGTVNPLVNFVETILSVHDRGNWVADVNVLEALDATRPNRNVVRVDCANKGGCKKPTIAEAILTTIDCWDELLETPPGNIVIRASGNGLARLALTVICAKLGFETLVLPDEFCWGCCCELLGAKSSKNDAALIKSQTGKASDLPTAIILGSRRTDVPQNQSRGIEGCEAESTTPPGLEKPSSDLPVEAGPKELTNVSSKTFPGPTKAESLSPGTLDSNLKDRIDLSKAKCRANLQLTLQRRQTKEELEGASNIQYIPDNGAGGVRSAKGAQEFLVIWEHAILPFLVEFVPLWCGPGHTIGLRRGRNPGAMVISIMTEDPTSEARRSEIQRHILDILPLAFHHSIGFIFRQGIIKKLAAELDDDICEPQNPYYYYQPTMGDSVGISLGQGDDNSTSTLGPCIVIGSDPFWLVNFHPLEDAALHRNESAINLTLEHPSPDDRSLCVHSRHGLLTATEPNFVLGKVAAISGTDCKTTRLSKNAYWKDIGLDPQSIVVDWALCSANSVEVNFLRIPAGVGEGPTGAVTSVINDFSGTSVQSTGRTSGLQRGSVCLSPETVSSKINGTGNLTREWFVEEPYPYDDEEGWIESGIGVSGDSGAAIINCDNDAVCGQLWGRNMYEKSQIGPRITYFTPIADIFDDIQEKYSGKIRPKLPQCKGKQSSRFRSPPACLECLERYQSRKGTTLKTSPKQEPELATAPEEKSTTNSDNLAKVEIPSPQPQEERAQLSYQPVSQDRKPWDNAPQSNSRISNALLDTTADILKISPHSKDTNPEELLDDAIQQRYVLKGTKV